MSTSLPNPENIHRLDTLIPPSPVRAEPVEAWLQSGAYGHPSTSSGRTEGGRNGMYPEVQALKAGALDDSNGLTMPDQAQIHPSM